jgi:hypothetical protein
VDASIFPNADRLKDRIVNYRRKVIFPSCEKIKIESGFTKLLEMLSFAKSQCQHFHRVFDFLLKEKASDVASSLKGLLFAIGAVVLRQFRKDNGTYVSSKFKEAKEPSIARFVLASALFWFNCWCLLLSCVL